MECGNTRNYYFRDNASKIYIKLKKYYSDKFSETTGVEIQSQHWSGNMYLSIKDIAVQYFLSSIDHGDNKENLNFIHI